MRTLNFIIYDLEATCWEKNPINFVQEIIEIGAYMLNPYGEILGEYNRFIKPVIHPTLSVFCHELTSITQEQIDRAGNFVDVIEEFQDWAMIFEEDYFLCSWGSFDRKQLILDCKLHDMDYDWVNKHLNLKGQYQEMKRLHRPCSLKHALRREGFEFDGTHHRGIDDAENLAKIFNKFLDVWAI